LSLETHVDIERERLVEELQKKKFVLVQQTSSLAENENSERKKVKKKK